MKKLNKNILVVGTGGTVASQSTTLHASSYRAFGRSIESLFEAIPIPKHISLVYSQFSNIPSQDFTLEDCSNLRNHINEKLQDIDGVVVVGGTCSKEVIALFLHYTLNTHKPVVMVGTIRPPSALSADVNRNLLDAVLVASNDSSTNRGVLIAMNNEIHSARYVMKVEPQNLAALQSPNFGALGRIYPESIRWLGKIEQPHTQQSSFSLITLTKLPKVEIISCFEGAGPELIENCLQRQVDGIVLTCLGNGNIPISMLSGIQNAQKQSTWIVKSSWSENGDVTLNAEVDDINLGLVAANDFSARKARVLLSLVLAKYQNKALDRKTIQQYFDTY